MLGSQCVLLVEELHPLANRNQALQSVRAARERRAVRVGAHGGVPAEERAVGECVGGPKHVENQDSEDEAVACCVDGVIDVDRLSL